MFALLLWLSVYAVGAPAFPLLLVSPSFANSSTIVTNEITGTWVNPSDTLTILLIVGGDIVAKALAQLAGPQLVPVAFSFGWVAYAFNTLMSVAGDGRLMPAPDYDAKLVNVQSGIWRDNRSWVLGRLLRDNEQPLEKDVALCIRVYHVIKGGDVVLYDWCYISGLLVIILQLGIAAIPCGVDGDWSILLVTLCGTILALLTGTLPQWKQEKYPARRKTHKVVALTGGNGSRNVLVIIDDGVGLDLEDLAAAQGPMLRYGRPEDGGLVLGVPWSLRVTQIASTILLLAWITLLITVTGLKTHPWYLLLVGGLGMLQNVIAAGAQRAPGTSMIHLETVETIKRRKVMFTLMDAEKAYRGLGETLLPEFFAPETLNELEKKWWDGDTEPYDAKRSSDGGSTTSAVTESTPRITTQRDVYRRIVKPHS